jgi:phosphoribosylformylglycinamidine synthase
MGEACLKFDTPVTGGNVSFYNQNPDGAVYPTPTIGMVGLLDSDEDKMTLGFKNEGDAIYLIGKSTSDIGSSEYLHKICGVEFSPVPHFNLEDEFALQQELLSLIKSKLVVSAHDVSEGGLFITLLESAFVQGLGFDVNQLDLSIRPDAFWFGESQSRVVVSVSLENLGAFEKAMNNNTSSCIKLGSVKGSDVVVGAESWGKVSSWHKQYCEVLDKHMAS